MTLVSQISALTSRIAAELKSVNTRLDLRNRNLLNNGAMQIAHYSTSTAGITAEGYWTANDWYLQVLTLGTWTQAVVVDAPASKGFTKSLKMTCTTTDVSPGSVDYCIISNLIEGRNLQHLLKGTADAKTLTVSFWVKSTLTGTYNIELYDGTNARCISAAYTINSASTWEYKTATFSGDTTGALADTTSNAFFLQFWLAAGSNFSGGASLGTTWGTTQNKRAYGNVNLASNTHTWQITGVQLEIGSTASPFEFRTYAQETARILTPWTAVSFVAAAQQWINYGNGWQTMQYRKIGDMVQWRGFIAGGVVPSDVFIFPLGFRYPNGLYYISNSIVAPASYYISNNGTLHIDAGSSNTWISLFGEYSVSA